MCWWWGGGIVSCLVMPDLWRLSWRERVRVTSSGFRCFQNPPASLVTVTNTALTSTPSSHLLTSSLVTPFFLYTTLFILFLCHYIPSVSNFLFLYFFKIVICGQRDSPDTAALLATVNSLFLPHKVRTWRGCVISNRCVFHRFLSKDWAAAQRCPLIYCKVGTFSVAADS